MNITFLGAAGTVTGSKYLLEFGDKKILVDCGLFQGMKEMRLRNWNKLPLDPKTVSTVLLTHAHIDHSGYIPLFVKNGFHGKVLCTEGTKDLCEILLPDSAHLQEEEAEYINRLGYSSHKPALPLYTTKDVEKTLHHFKALPFNHSVSLFNDVDCEFLPAGHIIGSACIRIRHNNTSMLFTGDLGRLHDPVMKPPAIIDEIDYLVVESTYGNRLHEPGHPKEYLKSIINKTVQRGGTIIVPSFAVGRAQALLHYIFLLKQENTIPDIPVYLDSPMAINATHILLKHREHLRLSEYECHHLNQIATYTCKQVESKELDQNKMPKIIISASGMATGGRILFHLRTYAPDQRNTIVFTGYQAMGTRGSRLLNGEKEIKIYGEMIPVRAEIATLSNTSAHADYAEILTWLENFKRAPKKVFITHGEYEAATSLKQKIEAKFGWKCIVPQYQQQEILV